MDTAMTTLFRNDSATALREKVDSRLEHSDIDCYKCHVPFTVCFIRDGLAAWWVAFALVNLTTHLQLSKWREDCESCCHSFCKQHCSRQVPLPQLDELKAVTICDACYQRQDFINY